MVATFCIWTLRWQRLIAFQFRVFTWGATAVVLLLALAGEIAFETALHGIVISLISISLLIGLLVYARRSSLLNIQDPVLREAAHEAMILLIRNRQLSTADKRLLRKHFNRRHCDLGHCR
jgi:hypothetical protein